MARFGDLPVAVVQIIVQSLLMSPCKGLMAAAHACSGWRMASAACAWERLDVSAHGGWEAREARRQNMAAHRQVIDHTLHHTLQTYKVAVQPAATALL